MVIEAPALQDTTSTRMILAWTQEGRGLGGQAETTRLDVLDQFRTELLSRRCLLELVQLTMSERDYSQTLRYLTNFLVADTRRQFAQELPDKTSAGLPAMAALYPTFVRLRQLAELDENWDSYGAKRTTARAIFSSQSFLEEIAGELSDVVGQHGRPYVVAPIANGGVQLEWRTPHRDIEVEIGPHGELGYLLVTRADDQPIFEERDNVQWREMVDLVISTIQQ